MPPALYLIAMTKAHRAHPKDKPFCFCNEYGVTLIEIVIVIAIMGIVAAVAIPNYISFLPRYRLRAAAMDVYTNIQRAKINAIKNNTNMRIYFVAGTPGYYYVDEDGSMSLTSADKRINLVEYGSAVDFGFGNATQNWDASPLPTNPPAVITFNSQGTGLARSVFLENQSNNICYAITTLTSGSVRLRYFDGTNWVD